MILREKFQNFLIFASIHTSIYLNQDQGTFFEMRASDYSQDKPQSGLLDHIVLLYGFTSIHLSLNECQGSVFKFQK